MIGKHTIVNNNGHYDAYDDNGNFLLSGDTFSECEADLIEYIVNEAKINLRFTNEVIKS